MNYTLAPFWKRLLAFIIDFNFLVAIYFCTIYVEYKMELTGPLKLVLILIFVFSVYLLYPIMESSKIQGTPGKLMLGIVVTNLVGKRISFFMAFGRHLVKFGSSIFFFLSILLVVFRKKKQAFHDSAAKTLVLAKCENI